MAAELLDRVGIPDAEKRVRPVSVRVLGRHASARHDRHGDLAATPTSSSPTSPRPRSTSRSRRRSSTSCSEMQVQFNSGVLIITHDLGVVAEIADKVMVMYGGRTVEFGPGRRDLLQPASAVHVGAARLAAASRRDQEAAADADQGPAAEPAPAAQRLPVRRGAVPTRRRSARDTLPELEIVGRDHGVHCWMPREQREEIRAEPADSSRAVSRELSRSQRPEEALSHQDRCAEAHHRLRLRRRRHHRSKSRRARRSASWARAAAASRPRRASFCG